MDTRTAGRGVERGLVFSLLSGAIDWGVFTHHLLARAVERLRADAGELFLRDLEKDDLVLEAVHKLNPGREGKLRFMPGEGITGSALKHPAGLLVADRRAHPASRHPADFSATPLPSMMVVWLGENEGSTGMLALYREGVGGFSEADLAEANLAAKQLEVMLDFGAVVSSFAKHQAVRHADEQREAPRHFRGKMVAPGRRVGILSIHRHESAADILEHKRMTSRFDAPDTPLFDRALVRTRAELASDRAELSRLIPEAATLLFDAHEMMLQDDQFAAKIRRAIHSGMGVAQAIGETAAEYIHIFESSKHDHIREKARDIEDLALRLLDNLDDDARAADFEHGRIIVARELRPSEIVRIARANVGGVVLCSGGATAHIALLVKSLGIPTMIARSADVLQLADGLPALLNATDGLLLVNPADDVKALFIQRAASEPAAPPEPLPPGGVLTRDGARVTTLANVNLLSEVKPSSTFAPTASASTAPKSPTSCAARSPAKTNSPTSTKTSSPSPVPFPSRFAPSTPAATNSSTTSPPPARTTPRLASVPSASPSAIPTSSATNSAPSFAPPPAAATSNSCSP